MARRFKEILSWDLELWALRITGSGYPEHPLYIPGGTVPVPYPPEE